MNLRRYLFLAVLAVLVPFSSASAQDPRTLPRFTVSDLVYEGAFKVPSGPSEQRTMDYTDGQLAYDAQRMSFYMVGHAWYPGKIAEFRKPALVKNISLGSLNTASLAQDFAPSLLGRTATGNPQNLNRITGLQVFPVGATQRLLFNAIIWYDASASAVHTTGVVRNAANLAASPVDGYYVLNGGSGHVAGWISPIPAVWQPLLGGTYVSANGGNYSIISRGTPGPAMFTFNPERDLFGGVAVPNPVPTTKLLGYSIDDGEWLNSDYYNDTLQNKVWTAVSGATYGFVVPGTRTYLAIGHSGGHNSGVFYKGTQDCGNVCGGPCPKSCTDYSLYYWAYDLNDLLKVKNGELEPYQPRPYEFGLWPSPFHSTQHGGASFDPASGILYEMHKYGDGTRPVIVAHSFRSGGTNSPPSAPTNLRVD